MFLKKMYKILRSYNTDNTKLATNATLNSKINEVKNEIASVNLATTAVLTAAENKIPNAKDLFKK